MIAATFFANKTHSFIVVKDDHFFVFANHNIICM